MYIYKNKEKDANIGYVKVESKNGKCKLSINIKVYDIVGKEIKIFMFYRDKDEISPVQIPVGSIVAKSNICDAIYKTDSDNVFGSEISLDKMGGVFAIINDKEFCATEWDDKGINFSEKFLSKNDEVLSIKNIEEVIIEESEKDDYKEEEKTDVVPQIEKKSTPVEIHKNNDIINSGNDKHSLAKRIFEKLPGMYPFEDDEIIDCVKLEPYDIGIFPMDKWVLANNSFLLHGYYTYRHLIFAKKRGNGQNEYILGVPGIYRDRDRFMAGMFGFKNFKGVRNEKRNIGDFGYWYMEIRL